MKGDRERWGKGSERKLIERREERQRKGGEEGKNKLKTTQGLYEKLNKRKYKESFTWHIVGI